jgi:hypothetical protein
VKYAFRCGSTIAAVSDSMRERVKPSSIAVVAFGALAAIIVAGGHASSPHGTDRIVAEWQPPPKPRRRPPPRTPDPRAEFASVGIGQTVINANAQTPCPKRPGPPKFWEGAGQWNPCNGNLLVRMLGGLLVFNSERNSAIHPFHSTGGAPAGGYAGWGFKIGGWDQQLTPDDSGSPPASVTIADGEDGQDVYVRKAGSSNPVVYEDKEDKHWTLTTLDQQTWLLKTFEGIVLEYDTRPHGILLTSITDKAGNKTTINLDPVADTMTTVVDYLSRTWSFAYTNGNLTQITTPAPESLKYTLQYDTQGYDDLTSIQLPSTAEGTHAYQIGYVDAQGNHSPFPMSLQGPEGLTTFDFFQDGALVNVFYLPLSQTTAMFHAQYGINAGSNLVTLESPTENTPQTRIVYNGTFDQSGDPTQEFWITSVTDDEGITSTVARNSRHEVTTLTDGFNQAWTYAYYPNAEDVQTATDPAGKTTSYVWNNPGPSDGASSGELATTTDDATGLKKNLTWNPATSGFWYHTVDQISDPKVTLALQKTDLPSGAHAMREIVNGQLVQEVVLNARGDAVIETDGPGGSEKIGLDAYDQPSVVNFFAQGASIGRATVGLSPNGVFQSFTDVLGHSLKVGARDALLRVASTALILPGGEQDGTFGYASDTSDPDGNAVSGAVSAHGVQRGWLRQEASAAGVADCADAVVVNGQAIPVDRAKVVVAGARVGCGVAATPPPPPPSDAGLPDTGAPSDAGWALDAPPDVSLPEAGCTPPNGISCQVSELEQDGWCNYTCEYEPSWLCQDPMDCSGSGLEEWNCPDPILDPCPGF